MASNVVCCAAVGNSPEIWVRPAWVSVPNTMGMPPLRLKKLLSAVETFCWLTLSPAGRLNSARLRKASLAS